MLAQVVATDSRSSYRKGRSHLSLTSATGQSLRQDVLELGTRSDAVSSLWLPTLRFRALSPAAGDGSMATALIRAALLHGEDLAPVSGSGSVPSFGAPTVTRAVVVGGMPGWQIALIAAGAALLTAMLAVLAGRVRAAHHKTAPAS